MALPYSWRILFSLSWWLFTTAARKIFWFASIFFCDCLCYPLFGIRLIDRHEMDDKE